MTTYLWQCLIGCVCSTLILINVAIAVFIGYFIVKFIVFDKVDK